MQIAPRFRLRLLWMMLTLVVVSGAIRVLSDPTFLAKELPYSEFQAMLDQNTVVNKVRAVILEAGMKDRWGREIELVRLCDEDRYRYIFVPGNFYSEMFHELPRRGVRVTHICSMGQGLTEVFAALVLTAISWTVILVMPLRNLERISRFIISRFQYASLLRIGLFAISLFMIFGFWAGR